MSFEACHHTYTRHSTALFILLVYDLLVANTLQQNKANYIHSKIEMDFFQKKRNYFFSCAIVIVRTHNMDQYRTRRGQQVY